MSIASRLLGKVTQSLPGGGEAAYGQIRMTEAVSTALTGPNTVLIEAGTGTGKSVAYLAPLIAAGKRAVVATATIARRASWSTRTSRSLPPPWARTCRSRS